MEAKNASFSVDVAGLLEALTEQFPEPLLCVRELIQNAADAGARHIGVDISFDGGRGLVRIAVKDDGRGMGRREVEGYLTIGLSEKDPHRQRGRFGIGKLSPYALGFQQMVVETCDGSETHRLEFRPDGSGSIERKPPGPRGTVVRVYKACSREEAEALSDRAFAVAKDSCGSLAIPLHVNGVPVNHDVALPTPYVVRFDGEVGSGIIGVGGEPVRTLMGGGIVLEMGAPVLGPEVSYILDAPRLSPTLSRNAVRRDRAFDELLSLAQSNLRQLVVAAGQVLRQRVERYRQSGAVVERALGADDRAAMEWLRARLLDPDGSPPPEVRDAPVLETADGDLVSASALASVLRRERRVPISRVPRTRDEIAGYVDRGVPVLLLYRDLEDFLERQSIATVEVDGLDDGVEVDLTDWGRGELALVQRPRLTAEERPSPGAFMASAAAALTVIVLLASALAVFGPPNLKTGSSPPPAVSAVPDPGAGTEAVAAEATPASPWIPALAVASTVVAVLSAAAGGGLFALGARRRHRMNAWLRNEAGVPIASGEGRRRRFELLLRMVLHPIDFAVARGWSLRSAGAASRAIAGYRAFVPEAPIRAGARLDLDRLELGFMDLLSKKGDPSDARLIVRRSGRVLLNRNHPTVRNLICIAAEDSARAHVLLEALLATDPELARSCDPRQVEWDLVGRAPRVLGGRGPK